MEELKKFVWFWMLWFVIVANPVRDCSGQTPVPGTLKNKPSFRAGEIIVKIRDEQSSLSRAMATNTTNTGSRNLNLLNQQFGVTKVEQVFRSRSGRALQPDSPLSNVLLLTLQAGVEEQTALRAYASLEEVEYAELNYWYYIFATTNDVFLSSQYALYSSSYQGIDAIGGWDIEQGNASVIIAIVDTGIDYTHEDLAGKVIKGYDFVNEDFDPKDDNGHGTHVAGITGAIANNGKGIAGVCPGCSLLAVKVVTAGGAGANSWIANGIANAVNLGARVINLSLGGLDSSNTIKLAVEQAYQNGVVIVAASGNDGNSIPMYPAAFPEVIAVGATDRSGDRASFSNYGSHLELMAPGQAIYSTLPGNSYEAWNGTSMACPHVAGLAGLILSRDPGLTSQQVRQVLDATAEDLGSVGRDSSFGYGRINALAALTQTPDQGGTYPTPNPEPVPYPTPSPQYPGLCGQGLEGLLAVALLGLGWVHLERQKRRKDKLR
jgi:thermitase